MGKRVSLEDIKTKIYRIRGYNVMLDRDLAELYDVQTKVLLQAVKRNRDRFPGDFMFIITNKEVTILRSQFVTSSWGGRRYLPCVFTEQGVAMLSSVLNSKRAIKANIQIMRVFVSMRRMIMTYESLRRKIETLEKKYDGQFKIVFDAIRKLMEPPPAKKKRGSGFM